jgi:hypothetical protein
MSIWKGVISLMIESKSVKSDGFYSVAEIVLS